jgi:hypothetical protein
MKEVFKVYENLNKYSVVDVTRTLLNEINAYNPTHTQLIDIFVNYMVIPFCIYLVLELFWLYIFKKINLKSIIIAVITSVWFVPSLSWLIITSLMGASFIVVFTPMIPLAICMVISWLVRLVKHKKIE